MLENNNSYLSDYQHINEFIKSLKIRVIFFKRLRRYPYSVSLIINFK